MTTVDREALRLEMWASLPYQCVTHTDECARCALLLAEGQAGNVRPVEVVLTLAAHLRSVPGAVSAALEARAVRFPDLVDALWSCFPSWRRSILFDASLPLGSAGSPVTPPAWSRAVTCSRAWMPVRAARYPEWVEATWSRLPRWSPLPVSVEHPSRVWLPSPSAVGLSWFDVALWQSWPHLIPDRLALVEAPSPFAAVETLMRACWLWRVAHASAAQLGGPSPRLLRYQAHDVWVPLLDPEQGAFA